MTRDVICFVTNNTTYQYTPSTNLAHGQEDPQEPIAIEPSSGQTQIFSFSKTTWSAHGVTGTVSYTLKDSSVLLLAFNCPYTQSGQESNSNCWFYAGITNIPSSGTMYYLDTTVTIDGNAMNAGDPATGDTVIAYITINLYN